MKAKNKRKRDLIFIFLQVFLVIAFFSVFFYSYSNTITLKAVYDFEEGGNISQQEKIISMDYQEGLEKEISFSVSNEEHKNMKVFLMAEGELNDSIILNQNLVEFMPSEDAKSLLYKIKLNRTLGPGLHTARITGLEIPKTGPEEGYSSSKLETFSEIRIYVPYPGKYIDADLNVFNAEQNSTADFSVSVMNRGKEKIENAKAIIEIYSLLDEKIDSIETDNLAVDAGKGIRLNAKWNVRVFSGDYVAKTLVFYDNEKKSFEKKFAVGAKNFTIEGMLVNNFQLGGIAKMQILVENKWNQELKDVFANLLVYDSENQLIANVKSSSDNIPALSKKELVAYWDTADTLEGEYNGKLIIKYEDKTSEKDLILRVSQDSLDVFGIGYVLRPKLMQGTSLTMVLLILVIILLIVNLAWFVFFRRIMGKSKKKTFIN